MGFGKGKYATVWAVDTIDGSKNMSVRLSTDYKNKQTGEFVQDFSGFCTFIGTAATDARTLKAKDRIRIGDCEVTNRYDKEKRQTYHNYKIFDFTAVDRTAPKKEVDSAEEGENDEPTGDLPF